jgi:hypothetical protein
MPVSLSTTAENGYLVKNLETFVINVVLAAKVAINYE